MRALARLSNLGTPRSGGVCAAAGRSGESRRGGFSDASRTCMKPPQPGSALSLASCSGGMAHSRRNARRSHPLPVMPVLLCVGCVYAHARRTNGSLTGHHSARAVVVRLAPSRGSQRARNSRRARGNGDARGFQLGHFQIRTYNDTKTHPTDRRNPWPPLPDRARHSSPRAGSVPR